MSAFWLLRSLAPLFLGILLAACTRAPTPTPVPATPTTIGLTATPVPTLTPVPPTPTQAPPTPTPVPPTPTPVLEADITVEGPRITVRAKPGSTLAQVPAGVLERIAGVVGAENLLVVEAQPHPIIGVEPGAPLRVVLGDTLAVGEVVAGQGFVPEDAAERVAIVGSQVFVEDYTQPSGAMPGMVHLFEIGQSFVLPDAEVRVRVVGRYATRGQVLDRVVFLPLATVQRLYGLEGRVTHIFVTVDSPANVERVAQEVRAVLAAQQQE